MFELNYMNVKITISLNEKAKQAYLILYGQLVSHKV